MDENMVYLLRLFLAVVLGFAVGFERRLRSKEAAIRTHTIVAVGACLFMLVSKYGFFDMDGTKFDASRIAAQVVSGIGFIGAGMIFYKKQTVYGLTTAAGVWTTAGIGMATGAGMYLLSIGAALMVIFAQFIMHIRCKLFTKDKNSIIKIVFIGEENLSEIKSIFKVEKFYSLSVKRSESNDLISVAIANNAQLSEEYLLSQSIQNSFILSFDYNKNDVM